MSSPGARAPGPPQRPQHAQLSKAPGNGALSRFALMLDEPMPAVINRGPMIDHGREASVALNCPIISGMEVWSEHPSGAVVEPAPWKRRAQQLQHEAYVAYFVFRHPLVPWYSKVLAAVAVGYVFSPIQLIPSFIPLIGVLDDLLVLVVAVKLMRKITPPAAMAECRARAESARWRATSGVLAPLILAVAALGLLALGFMGSTWRLIGR